MIVQLDCRGTEKSLRESGMKTMFALSPYPIGGALAIKACVIFASYLSAAFLSNSQMFQCWCEQPESANTGLGVKACRSFGSSDTREWSAF